MSGELTLEKTSFVKAQTCTLACDGWFAIDRRQSLLTIGSKVNFKINVPGECK